MECYQLKILISVLLFFIATAGSNQDCGRPIGSVTVGKIVGGYDVGYYKYPWFVSLKRNGHHSCGATLIHKKFVLTAAHCFDSDKEGVSKNQTTYEAAMQPTIGVYNVCNSEETQKKLHVEKVYIHEDYEKKDPFSDLALIKLKSEAKDYMPACLPHSEVKEKNRPKEAIISGLGVLKFGDRKAPCEMHEARVLINDEQNCKKMLNSSGENPNNLKGAFCAGYLSGGIDACQGDSGGPLIALGKNSRYKIVGVTSFGYKCASKGKLGLYTDVGYHLGWIKKKIGKDNGDTETTESTETTADEEETTEPSKVTTVSSGDWDKYPATKWNPVTITYVPWQTLPPLNENDDDDNPDDYPHPKPHPSDHNRPIYIIINKKKSRQGYEDIGHHDYNDHIEAILNENVPTPKPTKKSHHNKHLGHNYNSRAEKHHMNHKHRGISDKP